MSPEDVIDRIFELSAEALIPRLLIGTGIPQHPNHLSNYLTIGTDML